VWDVRLRDVSLSDPALERMGCCGSLRGENQSVVLGEALVNSPSRHRQEYEDEAVLSA
jgi:hypothetical protein